MDVAGEVAGGLDVLAVVDDVDAQLDLAVDDLLDCARQPLREGRHVSGRNQRVHVCRPGQVASVRNENAISAVSHKLFL